MNTSGYLHLTALAGFMVLQTSGETQTACEGSRAVMRCPIGSTINVIHANYGRSQPGERICNHSSIRTTNCHSIESTEIAMQRCNRRRICYLSASNDVFGDPCSGTHKYLEVVFLCVQ